MSIRNVFIISLSAIFLVVFCWMLTTLTKSVGKFTSQFSELSSKQIVEDTDEPDATQQDTDFSSDGSLLFTSNSSDPAYMGTSSSAYSMQDDAEIDELVEIIARLAAEAGMDPIDFLDMLLEGESRTDSSKATVQRQLPATGSNPTEAVSPTTVVSLQTTSTSQTSDADDAQSAPSTSTTTTDELSPEELQQLFISLSGADEQPPSTISEENYQEENSYSVPADSEPETGNYVEEDTN